MAASPGPPRAKLCSAHRAGDVLCLSGEIDHVNEAAVTGRIVAEIRDGVGHLDLSAVSYCGAAGIRALLAGRDARHATGGTLLLTCSPAVLRIVEVCGLTAEEGLVVAGSGARR